MKRVARTIALFSFILVSLPSFCRNTDEGPAPQQIIAAATDTNTVKKNAVYGLIKRLLPEPVQDKFVVEIIAADKEQDVFECIQEIIRSYWQDPMGCRWPAR